ncbi:MAG TPA: FeoA family protein [Saprospiraceae bacterium]|nr:FeoA family protein [Saprospiraceae bacterium]
MQQEYRITGFKDPALAARLIAMGLYPGKILRVIRKAYFGGAYYIEMDDSRFALRESEWDQINLSQDQDEGTEI